MTPMVMLEALAVRALSATRLRRYESRSIGCFNAAAHRGGNRSRARRMARETVAVETPARRATSAMRDRVVPIRSRLEVCAVISELASENLPELGADRPGLQKNRNHIPRRPGVTCCGRSRRSPARISAGGLIQAALASLFRAQPRRPACRAGGSARPTKSRRRSSPAPAARRHGIPARRAARRYRNGCRSSAHPKSAPYPRMPPLARNNLGIGNAPHSGKPGAPTGLRAAQDQHAALVDIEVRIDDAPTDRRDCPELPPRGHDVPPRIAGSPPTA